MGGKMNLKRYWYLMPMILAMAVNSASAQNLINGRRAFKDTISFPVEITQGDDDRSHHNRHRGPVRTTRHWNNFY
jgi:hypothetical protein